ncbi:MAG: class II aldolase/adducin family protein, partial [Chloroflexi bacterium]|nr:class II aldolase/adducin family protein [Chloroflexota bacterium]
MTSLSYSELREQVVQAAQRLHTSGVMSHSGHGNMSVRLPESEHMLLTSVSHISDLKPEQLVVVTFDGEVVEGSID